MKYNRTYDEIRYHVSHVIVCEIQYKNFRCYTEILFETYISKSLNFVPICYFTVIFHGKQHTTVFQSIPFNSLLVQLFIAIWNIVFISKRPPFIFTEMHYALNYILCKTLDISSISNRTNYYSTLDCYTYLNSFNLNEIWAP